MKLNTINKKSITHPSEQNSDTLPLLVFDFDGVISNSIHDSFRTALNTYIKMFPENRLPLTQSIHPPDTIFDFENGHPALFNHFKQLIPFGNRAEDYFVILRIIEHNRLSDMNDQKTFNDFKTSLSPTLMASFQKTFYSLRRSYQQADEKSWSGLLPAFPGVIEAIKILSRRFILAIATSKDRTSIDIQLKSYGLDTAFSPQNILDKDLSDSKKHHLEKLSKIHNIHYNHMHFIDDKVLHLISVAELGVHCYLPVWGFNTLREHVLARKNGFHLLTIQELSRIGLSPEAKSTDYGC